MLWSKLKFFKSRSNGKVAVTRSKTMVPFERSFHKEYTYEMSIFKALKVKAKVKGFVHASNTIADDDARAMT